MASLQSYWLASLLCLATLVECFVSRTEISAAKSIKMQFSQECEDEMSKATSENCKIEKRKEQSGKNLDQNPNYIIDDTDDDSENYVILEALASQVEGEYYGTKATMDVYNFPIGKSQSSYGLINLRSFKHYTSVGNEMIAGWHVDPERYGDQYTHFFIAWEGLDQKRCFNFECKGFVLHKSSKIMPGTTIQQSPGKGKNITLEISTNQITRGWFLYYEQGMVGYWPKSLFTWLKDYASFVQWGGKVKFLSNDKAPPMGSGHFPLDGKEEAASIWNVNVIEKNGQPIAPTYDDPYIQGNDCFKVITGDVIFYGGPSGCTSEDSI